MQKKLTSRMSSDALNQIANALQNGIGLSISTSGFTWNNPPPIGFGQPNTALFTDLSTTTFATSSFTATGGINNTSIGQQTSNLGNFTILTASTITGPVGQVTSNAGNFTQLQASSISGRANTFFTSSLTANAIDAATIGLTTSNTGNFTQLQASTLTAPIGLATSNAGNFTQLQASSIFAPNVALSTLTASTITLVNSLLITTSTITVSGLFSNTGITSVQEIIETLNLKSTTSGVVTHDWSTGAIWYHSSMTNNFTVALTNVPFVPNRSLVTTLILNQGATPYYASALTVNSIVVPIKWPSATVPTPTASRTEIESLTLFYIGTTWTALGQYTSFG